jgi:hypothetical protein
MVVAGSAFCATIAPHDGWGYFERDFGDLSEPFEVEVKRVGKRRLVPDYGWMGRVTSIGHRYAGRRIVLTPRHEPFDSWVVVKVFDNNVGIGAETLFSGMAQSVGLK